MDNNVFVFEFHSLLPVSSAKNILEAQNSTTVNIFGRTSCGKSVCARVQSICPYFYVSISNDTEISVQVFGGDERLSTLGLNSTVFSLEKVQKMAFYHFQTESSAFMKVSCCSEGARKRMLEFIKLNTDLGLCIYEVSFLSAKAFITH